MIGMLIGEEWLNIDSMQVRLQPVRVLKAAEVMGLFFQKRVFYIKTIYLPAFNH